jgi:hypothetical protein
MNLLSMRTVQMLVVMVLTTILPKLGIKFDNGQLNDFVQIGLIIVAAVFATYDHLIVHNSDAKSVNFFGLTIGLAQEIVTQAEKFKPTLAEQVMLDPDKASVGLPRMNRHTRSRRIRSRRSGATGSLWCWYC